MNLWLFCLGLAFPSVCWKLYFPTRYNTEAWEAEKSSADGENGLESVMRRATMAVPDCHVFLVATRKFRM
jgi:hypothetical protein